MKTVIARVLSFGPLFDKLLKISSTYLDNNIIIESYNQMKNIFNTWADTLKKQNSFFLHDVKEYLKIISGNYHHLRELVQFVEKTKANYNKISKNLTNKKMDLFRKGDMSSWQLDAKDKNNINEFYSDRLASYKKICFKETNNVIKLKEKYGYQLNKIIFEYQRLRNINTKENKEKVIQFSQKQSQIVTDHNKIMGEIMDIMEKCVIEQNKDEIDAGRNLPPSAENYEQIEKKDENSENIISTGNYEPQKEDVKKDIIEEKNEYKNGEIKNEIKEEKVEDNKIEKSEDNIEQKKEENNEEKKEENEEEKKEEKEKVEEKKIDGKDEQINNEDKKEEIINEDKKEEKIVQKEDEKNEEKIEEKKEDIPNEKNDEEK
jgi:hypothetical protein